MAEGRINVQTTGLFGVPEKSHKTTCKNSNNPHGHSRECPCDWVARERASQTVPYLQPMGEMHTFYEDDGPVT